MKKTNIILILLSIFLFSCNVERRLQKIYVKHPELLAQACNRFFPSDGTEVSTIITYLPGDTLYLPGDSVYIDCDTTKGLQVIQCPPTKIIHDTVKEKIEKKVFDSARSFLLNRKIDSLVQSNEKKQNKLEEFEDKVKKRNRTIGQLIAVIVASATAFILWVVYKIK
jgi:hypothetical protein